MAQSWRIGENEFKYVREVLEGGFPGSSKTSFTKRLEAAFAEKFGVRFAVSMVNGTATLHAALVAAGVRPGDEVIVPPLTMSSTTYAVLHAGAVPVFADIDPDTFVMSTEAAEKCITNRTRAIMPVSLFGLAPDFDGLRKIADEHNIPIIEDDAQCFLGRYKGKLVGTFGDLASFSFQNSKHMTCGEGGMVITDNPEYALAVRRFAGLGYSTISNSPGSSVLDKSQLHNPAFERHIAFGYNYRLGELPCAAALAQLEKLDRFVAMRQKCAAAFGEALKGVEWLRPQQTPPERENSYWAYVVRIADDKISWEEFYRRFISNGGDGFYGAWRLTYDEPYFRDLIPAEHRRCPVADATQPRLMQFKTHYGDDSTIAAQAEALAKTIRSF